MKLINPLTSEEKHQASRLLDHDMVNEIGFLMNDLDISQSEGEHVNAQTLNLLEHIAQTTRTVYILGHGEEIYARTEPHFNGLKGVFGDKVKINCVDARGLKSIGPIAYSAIFNIVKNGVGSNTRAEVDSSVVLLSQFSDFPKNALYIPEGARDFERFVAFNVHDQGEGFAKDKPLVDYLERDPPKIRDGGFGLYFVSLASKILRAPVNIKSEPGNTNVTFYHPIYGD